MRDNDDPGMVWLTVGPEDLKRQLRGVEIMGYAKVSLAALNSDAAIKLDNALGEEIYIRVSGTFTGTLTPGTSIDGVNYDTAQVQSIAGGAAQTTITAPGAFVPTPAVKWFGSRYARLRMTAYTSGTAVVEITTTMTARA